MHITYNNNLDKIDISVYWWYDVFANSNERGLSGVQQVFRREQKYVLQTAEALRLCAYLEKVLQEDSHNGPGGYAVRSLYFDTMSNRDFHEKEDGADPRSKLRLRCYGPDADFALLEMKQKQGESQRKRSLRVSRGQAQQLAEGRYSCLLEMDDPFAKECFAVLHMCAYRPKAIVTYNRKAFVLRENRTRVTLDSQIRATESSGRLFDPSLSLYPVLDSSLTVLEIKYNGFLLSYVQDAVNRANRSTEAVSKYALGRMASMHKWF